MRILILLAAFTLVQHFVFAQKKIPAPTSMRVMTYNIRNSNAKDSTNAWEFRKDNMAAQIKYHHPDLLGVQEALPDQVKDLQDRLADYGFYGRGRNEGGKSNEYSAIFFRKSRYKLLDSGTFWLSEQPSLPGSKSWDAALPRICSWVKFSDANTGKKFFLFNTHFDHVGKIARANSSQLILQKVTTLAGALPVILIGDFNTAATGVPYRTITADSTGFADAQFVSQTPHYGPLGTSSGFWVDRPLKNKIDFIFVKNKIDVLQHAVLTDQKDNRYNSDHLAVIAELEIK